jgi:hypothetical protein
MAEFKVPLIIRGEVIEDYSVEFRDRGSGGHTFVTPSVEKYLHKLVAKSPLILEDLYTINFDEICEYLDELRRRLDLDTNSYWREAFEISCHFSNLSRSVLEAIYRNSPNALAGDNVRQLAEGRIGVRFLEGWVRTELRDGRAIEVRAVGSRSVHVIAGNVPVVPISTLLRGAITRSDVIVKVPSNDPITMGAIARTMIDMAPNHPITRHLSVAYWKGGDESVEERIYQPQHIERLVAWGGFASIKHITKYLQPGIDLIPLEPKSSTTLIGKEALADDETMREVARRVAADVGGYDQEACTNARVMFLESGTDAAGIALANQFGLYVFQAVQGLPQTTSCGPVNFDPVLRVELESIAQQRDFYRIFTEKGRTEKTGAIIVSQVSEQVDFPSLLYGRVGNIVPVDRIDDALDSFSAATKAAGIYPDSLRSRLRDRGALMGGQSFIPIGYAISSSAGGPSDGIEPERRMCRWVVDVRADPTVVAGPWMHEEEIATLKNAKQRQFEIGRTD